MGRMKNLCWLAIAAAGVACGVEPVWGLVVECLGQKSPEALTLHIRLAPLQVMYGAFRTAITKHLDV